MMPAIQRALTPARNVPTLAFNLGCEHRYARPLRGYAPGGTASIAYWTGKQSDVPPKPEHESVDGLLCLADRVNCCCARGCASGRNDRFVFNLTLQPRCHHTLCAEPGNALLDFVCSEHLTANQIPRLNRCRHALTGKRDASLQAERMQNPASKN